MAAALLAGVLTRFGLDAFLSCAATLLVLACWALAYLAGRAGGRATRCRACWRSASRWRRRRGS
jgi:predicted benzoate:H+ symporter BenE